jgi:tRNA nucleotidyltransferase (CCA-adding enzyme)
MLTAPQGVADLRAGLLRTPLPPGETLGQDPLRILRCIRFAARFGFRIDAQLAAAMKDAALQVC